MWNIFWQSEFCYHLLPEGVCSPGCGGSCLWSAASSEAGGESRPQNLPIMWERAGSVYPAAPSPGTSPATPCDNCPGRTVRPSGSESSILCPPLGLCGDGGGGDLCRYRYLEYLRYLGRWQEGDGAREHSALRHWPLVTDCVSVAAASLRLSCRHPWAGVGRAVLSAAGPGDGARSCRLRARATYAG